MSKFDELKKRAEAALSDSRGYSLVSRKALFLCACNPEDILELLAIQAQLVEALKLFTDFPQDVLTMPADESYTFSVQGWYFSKACAALAAAGAQP